MIFGVAGFAEEDDADLRNELRLAGAQAVSGPLDVSVCTHLLVEEEQGGAEVARQVHAARAAGIAVVDATWLSAATGFEAMPPTSSSEPAHVRSIHFQRLVLDTSECDLDSFWGASDELLCEVSVESGGTIEDIGAEHLQLDFANAYVGGGVLGRGCVQEEIRFLLCPELIVSRLLTERLHDHEALLMSGFERFSNYTGYARTFEYAGECIDVSDPQRRPQLVAIDARRYERHEHLRQFEPFEMERELNKAFVGFDVPLAEEGGGGGERGGRSSSRLQPPPLSAICTGNWGCGAFGGDLQLKALIQLLAASAARRPSVRYLTFGDDLLTRTLQALVHRLRSLDCTVGALSTMLRRFNPRKGDFHPPDIAALPGYYADIFGYLNRRCERVEERNAARAAEGREARGDGANHDVGHDHGDERANPTPPTKVLNMPVQHYSNEQKMERSWEAAREVASALLRSPTEQKPDNEDDLTEEDHDEPDGRVAETAAAPAPAAPEVFDDPAWEAAAMAAADEVERSACAQAVHGDGGFLH